ncbi:MAG TPA: hypothetical protein VMT34_12280, partial [Aggregatilineales bacterium]|nr:hypothetical protein [Aggregatilineales bacterium]
MFKWYYPKRERLFKRFQIPSRPDTRHEKRYHEKQRHDANQDKQPRSSARNQKANDKNRDEGKWKTGKQPAWVACIAFQAGGRFRFARQIPENVNPFFPEPAYNFDLDQVIAHG